MWNPYGRALMAIIPIKENMLLAEFKEKELDARLPLVRKKTKQGNKRRVFCVAFMRLAGAQMSDRRSCLQRDEENKKTSKEI